MFGLFAAAFSDAWTPSSTPCARTAGCGRLPTADIVAVAQVAYCPYDDSGAGAARGRMFSFPRVKREMLVAETRRMHALRQAKLQNALPDTQAPLLAGSLATRKKAVVVRVTRVHHACIPSTPRVSHRARAPSAPPTVSPHLERMHLLCTFYAPACPVPSRAVCVLATPACMHSWLGPGAAQKQAKRHPPTSLSWAPCEATGLSRYIHQHAHLRRCGCTCRAVLGSPYRQQPSQAALYYVTRTVTVGHGGCVQVGEAGNCLRVEVLRAANMPVTDFTGKSDPYVVLTAQSEAGLQMFRSKTAWATLVRLHLAYLCVLS